jgi:hypothetical protein
VVDNVDHLGHDSARSCGDALFAILTSSSHRVRGAIAVRPETADAIQHALDTAVKPARVSMMQRSLNPNEYEHERTRSPDVQRLRGYSRVFSAVRGSLRQSGRTVREPINTGDLGRLRSHLRSRDPVHARLCALPRPDVCHPIRTYV